MTGNSEVMGAAKKSSIRNVLLVRKFLLEILLSVEAQDML
jgi:hypothetical protein